ncbi:LysR family transcriptional regulator [Halomonas sp. LR5S13]|uniref:LysR family transcriptional regulator n=1 Tax=Halomonas rhizosphaerae TaxID=3043296 RepID=UPI0024A90D57|nr:LysR family transcriptional regulator [Halomonas rhizosphaerae]MDI5922658.1 LysR family transcriptional regulator [Halomonas rhizosphaerae]
MNRTKLQSNIYLQIQHTPDNMFINPIHLEQLAAIVDYGTFQDAATKLGTTQPALSRMIRTLEERTGSLLFERSTRPLVPTIIGLELAEQGRKVREARSRAAEVLDFTKRGIFGSLKIGAPPFLCRRLASDIISPFFEHRREIRVELVPDYFPVLQEKLILNQLDVVICPSNLVDTSRADLVLEPLFDDRIVVVCRPGHPLVDKWPIEPADLESVNWISHSKRSMLRTDLETALAEIGVTQLRFAFQSESSSAVIDMLRRNDYLTILPEYAVTELCRGEELVILPVGLPTMHRAVSMITDARRAENRLLTAFMAHVRTEVSRYQR